MSIPFKRNRVAAAIAAVAAVLGTSQAFGAAFALQENSGSGLGNAYATSGCEHFGVSTLRNATKTTYTWLKGNPVDGSFAPAADFSFSAAARSLPRRARSAATPMLPRVSSSTVTPPETVSVAVGTKPSSGSSSRTSARIRPSCAASPAQSADPRYSIKQ